MKTIMRVHLNWFLRFHVYRYLNNHLYSHAGAWERERANYFQHSSLSLLLFLLTN